MIINPLQKPLHKLRATMLPAIIHELIEYLKVFLEDWFVCLLSEMDINSSGYPRSDPIRLFSKWAPRANVVCPKTVPGQNL
jgi:hypothetical protein